MGVKWHALRVKNWGAHIDRYPAIILQARRDNSRHCLDANFALLTKPSFNDELHKRARAIAALLYFATIRIKDAIAKINTGLCRPLNHQNLIGANAKTAIR